MKFRSQKAVRDIDDYLAPLSADKRAALQRLRKTIHAAYPKAEETISYGIPAFRLDGKVIAWFGAAARHVSFYPGTSWKGFEEELAGYETSKGTIRFQPDHPLPAALVRKLVRSRIARNAAAMKKRKTTRAASRRPKRKAAGRARRAR
jgi:uncharacterized protein YdhG (YjbR/CyaY superfamily)